jgi:hypothetical protein
MRNLALALTVGSVVASLVACAAAPDESASGSAADTTTPSRGGGTRNNGDASAPTIPTDAGGPITIGDGGKPVGCYSGQGTCEPTNATSCAAGETCDINGGTGKFECFPPPNDAHLGDACDNSQGPFCSQGLACNAGKCATYCCDDSVCAAGTHCTSVGTAGTINVQVCQ